MAQPGLGWGDKGSCTPAEEQEHWTSWCRPTFSSTFPLQPALRRAKIRQMIGKWLQGASKQLKRPLYTARGPWRGLILFCSGSFPSTRQGRTGLIIIVISVALTKVQNIYKVKCCTLRQFYNDEGENLILCAPAAQQFKLPFHSFVQGQCMTDS